PALRGDHCAGVTRRRVECTGSRDAGEGVPQMNKPLVARLALQWGAVAAALMMLSGAGCQSTGPTVISNELPFDQAVIEATDGLVAQTQKMPAFLAKVEAKVSRKALIIDPMIDAASGQQIRITRQLEQKVA